MNFYTVMQHREQIGEDRVEAGDPVGIISVSRGETLVVGWLYLG